MGSISVNMSTTLDGVVQGPARADEDTRGGFTNGGCGQGYQDEVAMQEATTGMSRPGAMLLGAGPGRTSPPCGYRPLTATRSAPT